MNESKYRSLVDFVDGKSDTASLFKELHENEELKNLLDDHSRNWVEVYPWVKTRFPPHPKYPLFPADFSPYYLLLRLEKRSAGPGGAMNVQSVLEKYLDLFEIKYHPTEKYHDLHGLLLDAQPSWLDVDDAYLNRLLADIPETTKAMRKKLLREKMLSLFRFNTKPPRWIQSQQWPFSEGIPMVFVGQTPINKSEFFHDDGAAYVFYDPVTGSTQTIIQLY